MTGVIIYLSLRTFVSGNFLPVCEKNILKKFINDSEITNPNPFSFVSVGFNLQFEDKFLYSRCKANGIEPISLISNPHIDLKSLGIIMNGGRFKGCGLDKLTGKPHSGSIVSEWYRQEKYPEIESYIKQEATEFVNFCTWLYKELPPMLSKFKFQNNK